MTVTYQVGGGGHLDIDFWVCFHWLLSPLSPEHYFQLTDPDDQVLGKHIRQSTGSLSITAEKDGRHELCFSNQMSAVTDKRVRSVEGFDYQEKQTNLQLISFNVHGVIYVSGDGS
jgi:p24 family protein beta-1